MRAKERNESNAVFGERQAESAGTQRAPLRGLLVGDKDTERCGIAELRVLAAAETRRAHLCRGPPGVGEWIGKGETRLTLGTRRFDLAREAGPLHRH
jgi:hypothetical protein